MGAWIASSGARERIATSKRIWSLPARVLPCAIPSAPISRATWTAASACAVRSAPTETG
jgi:hypothetical protein